MSAVDIPAAIRAKFEKELTGYERLLAKADELFGRNQAKAFLDTARPSTAAVLGLYTKARKSIVALHVLATSGYGEDAMIIARSLINLCIDLGYICRTDSDDRARQWIARGRVSRREMAQAFGLTPPDEMTVDWGHRRASQGMEGCQNLRSGQGRGPGEFLRDCLQAWLYL